jgi:indole-3-glycerol phosphate synthase
MGEPGYISIVKNTINLPVLRKDFIIDEYQIYESRYLGADAVLLIAAVLDDKQLKGFYAAAQELEMDCLVEVHSERELYRVLETGAELVGINNRDLHTFKTDLSTTLELAGKVPPDRFLISESGISTRDDVEILKRAGVRGILIGEALVRADDIRKKLGSLLTENA